VSRGAVRIRASSETLYREPCFPDHDSTSVSKFTAGAPQEWQERQRPWGRQTGCCRWSGNAQVDALPMWRAANGSRFRSKAAL